MKCETCKHWELLDYPDTVDKHGQAVYFPEDDTAPELSTFAWGRCRYAYSPGDKYDDLYGKGSDRSQRMTVWDASDYAASLTTRSDFGCVEHEEKP